MRKAQMIGQIFIYIVAIIIIAFILVYGYNAIKTFIGGTEKVSFVKFKNDLSNMVEIISPDYASVKIRIFEVPSGYTKVCFVKNYEGFPPTTDPLFNQYPILKDSVDSGVKKNVFLIKERVEESFFIGDIDVDSDANGILCVPVISNKITIKFEGKGNHALLSKT